MRTELLLINCLMGFDCAHTVRMAEAGGDGALRVADGRQVLEARVLLATVLALGGDGGDRRDLGVPGGEVRHGGR